MTISAIPIALTVLVVLAALMVLVIRSFYQRVSPGQALVVNKTQGRAQVTFTGAMVLPIVHRAETMDISVKHLTVDRRGADGLICRDGIRADIQVTFWIRVDATEEGVLQVAKSIGCARASDPRTLEDLFIAKLSEGLKTVSIQLDFLDLYKKRDVFKDQVIQVIGRDLNGYVLEDASIDYLEQTPFETLDPNNISDARGIKKILELTGGEMPTKSADTKRIFDERPPANPRPLLPTPVQPTAPLAIETRLAQSTPRLRLEREPQRLSLSSEAGPICAVALTTPLQSFMAAETDKGMLVVEFRQQQMGQTVRLLFKTASQPLIDAAEDSAMAAEAFDGLPRLSVPCPIVEPADAKQLLSGLRWVLQTQGNEHWS